MGDSEIHVDPKILEHCNGQDEALKEEIIDIKFLVYSKVKIYVLVPLLSLCTLFLFPLVLYWFPSAKIRFKCSRVISYEEAKGSKREELLALIKEGVVTEMYVQDASTLESFVKLNYSPPMAFASNSIWFEYKFVRYDYRPGTQA